MLSPPVRLAAWVLSDLPSRELIRHSDGRAPGYVVLYDENRLMF